MKKCLSPYGFREGAHDGIPIALGYLLVSFGFGITAVGKGLRILETVFISMTNMTSAGQLAGVAVITAGGTVIEMILTQFVIGLRYSLMGISLTQRLDDRCTFARRLYLCFSLTDEIFVMASTKPEKVGPSYLTGATVVSYAGWTAGTLLGACAGNFMPERLQNAAELMIYAMFLAIMIPAMRKSGGIIGAILLSAGASCVLYYTPLFRSISAGFSIIICSVFGAAIMALLAPVKDAESEGEQ